jgi:ABC-type Mn2+/Zn2+ transport system ATPase subunit
MSMRFARDTPIDDVSYTCPKSRRPGLSHISLTVPNGSFVGIVGPSGGEKSTLIDVLLGLLHPDSGRVLAGQETIIIVAHRMKSVRKMRPHRISGRRPSPRHWQL